MICPACRANNREGARFCRNCGAELAPAEKGEAAVEPALPGSEPASGATPGQIESTAEAEGPVEELGEETRAESPGTPLGQIESTAEAEGPVEPPAEGPAPGAGAGAPLGLIESTGETEGPVEGPVAGPAPVAEVGLGTHLGQIESTAEAEGPVEGPEGETASQQPEAGPAPEWPEEAGGEAAAAPTDEVLFFREEAEPVQALEPGTLVAGRYRLLEALDVQPAQILYQAEDVQACWQCGFEGNSPKDAFCSRCGAALQTRPQVRLLQVAGEQSRPALPAGVELNGSVEHEGQAFFLVKEPPAPTAPLGQDLRLVAGHRSDTGRVRELDEDSLLAVSLSPNYEGRTAPALGLFAVADGMGGHEGGEVASKLALRGLAEHTFKRIMLPELAGEPAPDNDLLARLEAGIAAVNDAVYLARQKRGTDMGTTLTVLLVRDDRLFVAHVGDSRAYRWNEQGLEQLTTDHSVVASMIANGQAAPEDIYSHPHRSIIYRSIGDKPSVEIETRILPLAAGDRLLVCSDGLWEMVRNEGIADVMLQEADPQAACDLLVKHANLAGGEDNISVIVVAVENT